MNKTGKALKIVGIIIIVLGFLLSAILSSSIDYDVPVTLIVGGFVSVVSGIFYIGLSEIVNLLQKTVSQQQTIIKKMGEPPKKTAKPKTEEKAEKIEE